MVIMIEPIIDIELRMIIKSIMVISNNNMLTCIRFNHCSNNSSSVGGGGSDDRGVGDRIVDDADIDGVACCWVHFVI